MDLFAMARGVGIHDLPGLFLRSLLALDYEQRALQLGAARQVARFNPSQRQLNRIAAKRCLEIATALLADEERGDAA